MKNAILVLAVLLVIYQKNTAQTVTDYDGNVYHVISIGTQKWLQENLKVRHYNNGDLIPLVSDSWLWSNAAVGQCCYYDNDSAANAGEYGALYNWSAITDTRKICPVGYHVPTNAEWNTMEIYLDATVDTINGVWTGTHIGGILKEAGTAHWISPNTGATDSVGFSALPGGYRDDAGTYLVKNYDGGWWTSTLTPDINFGYGRGIDYQSAQINHNTGFGLTGGFSVRCICDSNTSPVYHYPNDHRINVYPNPATDKMIIENPDVGSADLHIYNTAGQLLQSRELKSNISIIDISDFVKGIYLIKVTFSNGTHQQKIIKN